MKYIKRVPIISIALFLFLATPSYGQVDNFRDASVDYSFNLPDPKWKMTVKPSPRSPNVEYVFVDRNDGHMEVRKLSTPRDTIMTDVVRDEEQKLQFLPGFVAGKEERFDGKLSGTVYNYEYVKSGRNMSGRQYFLRVNGTTVYVLRFTGARDKLRSIRNQTDSIARTFEVEG
ncbi:MAG: hypothetical protein WBD22_10965 [Pyrinomonadaceae bacterium]